MKQSELSSRLVDGARRDARLAALCDGDPTSRAWVLACLALAEGTLRGESDRRVLYERIATSPRRALLAELAGHDVPAAAVRTLGRTEMHRFDGRDWRSLLAALAQPADARVLGHVAALTATLVRQLAHIPVALRTTKLLAAAAKVRLSDERWRLLDATLAALPEAERTSLVRAARDIDGVAALWDYFFRCRRALEDSSPLPVEFPALGSFLVPLDSVAAMRREGRAMSNCMARCVRHVLEGQAVYYRWLAEEAADVELLRRANGGWSIGMMAGAGNATLSPKTAAAIRRAIKSALGKALLEGKDTDSAPPAAPGVEVAVAAGREVFGPAAIAELATALGTIRGRSVSSADGAFCIVSMPAARYVQFLARTDRPWLWTEVSSHRYTPIVEEHLTDEAVSLLEDCHLAWPSEQRNFGCSLPARSDAECDRIGAFALGMLHLVFGHRPGDPLSVKVHVPSARE